MLAGGAASGPSPHGREQAWLRRPQRAAHWHGRCGPRCEGGRRRGGGPGDREGPARPFSVVAFSRTCEHGNRRRLLRCVLQWPRHSVRNSAACHPERALQSVRGDWWMRRGGGTGSGGATDLRSSHASTRQKKRRPLWAELAVSKSGRIRIISQPETAFFFRCHPPKRKATKKRQNAQVQQAPRRPHRR